MEAVAPPDRRLILALAASLAVHGAVVAWLEGPPALWSFRLPAEVPRVLDVVMRVLPVERPPSRPQLPPEAPRPAAPRVQPHAAPPAPPAAQAAPAQPAPILAAPPEAPASEFRVPAAPSPPPAARAAAPEPPASPPRFDADYLDNPPPAYPLAARRRGLQGTVRLEVLVGRDGRAREVRLAESSGAPELDEAALRAVRDWRFVPARRGSEAVEASVIVPLKFQLERR